MNASAMPTTAGRGRDAVPAPRPDDRGTPMTHLLYVAGIFCLAAWFPASIQIGALLIIVGSFGRLRRPVAIPWAVLIFIGWALLSAAWSLLPQDTLDDVIKLLAVTVAGIFAANTVRPILLARDAALALAIVCAASLVAAVVSPGTSFDTSGAMRGITPHGNSLGFNAALAVLCALFQIRRPDRRGAGWIAVVVLGGVALGFSTSMTALLGLVAGLAGAWMVWFVRTGPRETAVYRAGGLLGALGAAGLLVLGNFDRLTLLIGRDPTFTGRTQIWSLILALVSERPLTGYGVGAPWRAGSPIRAYAEQTLGFEFVSAHNGLLDLVLEAGLVGLVVIIPLAVVAFVRYLTVPELSRGLLWALALCFLFATANMAEAYITSPFSWFLLCFLWAGPVASTPDPLIARRARVGRPSMISKES